MKTLLVVKQLSSGYWHIRGRGPCEWAQGLNWPDSLPEPFSEASDQFQFAVRRWSQHIIEHRADRPATEEK